MAVRYQARLRRVCYGRALLPPRRRLASRRLAPQDAVAGPAHDPDAEGAYVYHTSRVSNPMWVAVPWVVW